MPAPAGRPADALGMGLSRYFVHAFEARSRAVYTPNSLAVQTGKKRAGPKGLKGVERKQDEAMLECARRIQVEVVAPTVA